MAGFYARNYIFTGNGTQSHDNAKAICKGCVQALLRTGWQLDTTKHSDIDDIKEKEDPRGSNYYSCWYCLRSKSAGAKLLVYYNYYYALIPAAQKTRFSGAESYPNSCIRDIGLSIIPAGSNSEFGEDPTDEQNKFIPDDATYLTGIANNYNYANSWAYSNYNGRHYEFMFVSDGEETVFMFTNYNNSNYTAFCIGKIIGTLSYPEIDTSVSAKYGVISLTNSNSGGSSQQIGIMRSYTVGSSDDGLLGGEHFSSVFLPNGKRTSFANTQSQQAVQLYTDYMQTNAKVCSSYNNGVRRWSALSIAICNQNPATGETISGADGFKGFVDSNVLRYLGTNNINENQLLDDGSFLYIGDGCAIGWDASNTINVLSPNGSIDTRQA